jgi:hypothetical protein
MAISNMHLFRLEQLRKKEAAKAKAEDQAAQVPPKEEIKTPEEIIVEIDENQFDAQMDTKETIDMAAKIDGTGNIDVEENGNLSITGDIKIETAEDKKLVIETSVNEDSEKSITLTTEDVVKEEAPVKEEEPVKETPKKKPAARSKKASTKSKTTKDKK